MKIKLIDTFNGVEISTHNSVRGAVKAQRRHIAYVQRYNGKNSYVTYAFKFTDGSRVDSDEIMATRMELDQE